MADETKRLFWLFEYKTGGAHTHVKVRCGTMDHSRGNAGTIVLRNEEWETFRNMQLMGADARTWVEFQEMTDEVAEIAETRTSPNRFAVLCHTPLHLPEGHFKYVEADESYGSAGEAQGVADRWDKTCSGPHEVVVV